MLITSLPVELLFNICSNLGLSEWKALRLSDRAFYEITFDAFCNRYFKNIHFIAKSESLRILEDVAQSDAIRGRVQELWIIPSVFEGLRIRGEESLGDLAMSSKSSQPVKGQELKARYTVCKSMVADSSDLLESDAFSIRLSKCLERFVNVDTIGLAHYPTTYLLDPRQQKVRFLGWRSMINQIDFQFKHDRLMWLRGGGNGIDDINSLALSRFLEALIASNRTRKIRKLHTCNADFCGFLSPKITLGAAQYHTLLSSVLDGLEDLHICFAFQRSINGFAPSPPDILLNGQTWLNLLIKVAPRLRTLSYSHDYDGVFRMSPDYFWLLTQRMQFTRLKELHLHQAHVSPELLKTLITRVKETLTVLTLFEVRVVDYEATDDHPEPQETLGAQESINAEDIMNIQESLGPQRNPNAEETSDAQTPDTQQTMEAQDTLDAQENWIQNSPPPNPQPPDLTNHHSASPTSPTPQLMSTQASPTTPNFSPMRSGLSPLPIQPAHTQYPPWPGGSAFSPVSYSSLDSSEQAEVIWKRLWEFFGDNLSLQRFSMAYLLGNYAEITIESIDGLPEPSEHADFDAGRTDSPFSQWIGRLKPVPSPGLPGFERAFERDPWLERMFAPNSDSATHATWD